MNKFLSKLSSLITIFIITVFGLFFNNSNSVSAYAERLETLTISEINYLGSVDCPNMCTNDKWLELYNTSEKTINLEGYKVIFKNTTSSRGIITLDKFELKAKQTYLIAYKNKNLQSNLIQANVTPDLLSGKVLWIHNKDDKKIEVKLQNPSGDILFDVRLDTSKFETTDSEARSIEYTNNKWNLSSNEFIKNNFGTPENSLIYSQPISQPATKPTIEIVPEPKPVTTTEPPFPVTQTTPETIQAAPKIYKPEPIKVPISIINPVAVPQTILTDDLIFKKTSKIETLPEKVFDKVTSLDKMPLDSKELKIANVKLLNMQLTQLSDLKSIHFAASVLILISNFYLTNQTQKRKISNFIANFFDAKNIGIKLKKDYIYY